MFGIGARGSGTILILKAKEGESDHNFDTEGTKKKERCLTILYIIINIINLSFN